MKSQLNDNGLVKSWIGHIICIAFQLPNIRRHML